MNKLFKLSMLIIVVLALFIGSAMYLASRIIQPTTFKAKLTQAVVDFSGRQLTINGKVGLVFLPFPEVIVRKVSFDNSSQFADRAFADADKIIMRMRILPLFAGKAVIDELIVKNLTLHLERDSSELNNWNDIFTHFYSVQAQTDIATENIPYICPVNFEIRNANIDFVDKQYKKKYVLHLANINSSGINIHGALFPIHAAGALETIFGQFGSITNFALDSNVVADIRNDAFKLQNLQIKGDLQNAYLKNKLLFDLSIDVNSDLLAKEIDFDKLHVGLENLEATGNVKIANITYAPNVVGNIEIDTFDPQPLLRTFGLLPTAEHKKTDASKGGPQQGQLFSLWKKAALKVTLQTTSKFCKITNLEMHINDTVIKGGGSYAHFNDKLLIFGFDVNQIDLDPYFSNSQTEPTSSVVATAPEHKPTVKESLHGSRSGNDVGNKVGLGVNAQKAFPFNISQELLEILRQTILDGDLHIADLKLGGLHFNKVAVQVSGDKNSINFQPFSAKLYDGFSNGEVNINITNKIPSYVLTATFTNAALRPLFFDFMGVEKFSGTMNLKMRLLTMGDSNKKLLQHLHGVGNLSVTNGAFYGVDLNYQIARALSLIGDAKQPTIQESKPPSTPFSYLKSTFNVTNGILSLKGLLIKAQKFEVGGGGNIDLMRKTLDLHLGAAAHIDHMPFTIPIKVSGVWNSPTIKLDAALLLKKALNGNLSFLRKIL